MYVYNYRAFDKFRKDVISLAILTDDNPNFYPREYVRAGWGFAIICRFPIVKLIDYRKQLNKLENNPHPFALIVRVYLQTLETEGNFKERYGWKKRFLISLYASGMKRETIWVLYKFVDWMMKLPEELEVRLVDEIKQTKEAKAMSELTTSIERYAMKKGLDQGLKAGHAAGHAAGRAEGWAGGKTEGLAKSIAVILEIKFGEASKNLVQLVKQCVSAETLERYLVDLMHASTLTEAEARFTALQR